MLSRQIQSIRTYFINSVWRVTPIVLLIAGSFLLPILKAYAQQENPVFIYFFRGEGCPHCADEEPFLNELARQNPQVKVANYEVWYNKANQASMEKMGAAYGFEPKGVPTTFIGDRYWIGFSEQTKAEIEQQVRYCLANLCRDSAAGVLKAAEPAPAATQVAVQPASDKINLPLLGEIDLSKQSLTISTLLIAFVDGFNPCSIWVLTMLLALTLRTGSRKKILLVGIVFLTVTAGIYALFILGLFSIFSVINFSGWIQVIVALVALFFAMVNIKDYFWYKEGISFTISEKDKPGIYRRMRAVLESGDSIPALVGSSIVLAAGVSLVEFSCTAGFPVLWTNLLIAAGVGTGGFILLLLLYLAVYQLDELAIFFTAVYTLKSSKLEEKHGRMLKLAGGMLMLSLAIIMLVNPAIMNSLSSSLLVFLAAALATGLVLLLHRVVLPRFGVHIGTEEKARKNKTARRKK